MLSDVPAEDVLRSVADGLESVVLPALTGPAERRQVRAAVYLTRAVANAIPMLDATVDADITDISAALSLPMDPLPARTFVQRRADRNELVRQLSVAIAAAHGSTHRHGMSPDGDTDDVDTALLVSAARRSVERWLAVFPPDDSLGAFVHLDQTPATSDDQRP